MTQTGLPARQPSDDLPLYGQADVEAEIVIKPLNSYPTVEESVFRALRELIISEQLRPGTRLTQRDVAQQFGVSQTPVRVALGHLRREGFIVTKQGRAVVTHLTREGYEEIMAGRLGVESLAARLGAPAVSDDDVEFMKDMLQNLRQFGLAGDSRSYVKARWKVHSTCYKAADRPRLLQEVERAFFRSERYAVRLLSSPAMAGKSWEFQSRFVDACRRRSGVDAEGAVRDGIDWGFEELAEHFDSEKDLTAPSDS